MLASKVKMVIWDLDDTYWSGTLSEGGVTFIDENREIVKTLAARGIISSIVSKNERSAAEEELRRHGVWEYFVFPQIAFAPKGKAIADLIERANLRAENVLFIDDNHLNINEAQHYCPALMTADPKDILPSILELPELEGKADAELTRLQQYKRLETKSAEREASTLNNDEFLRQCDIRVTIDYDVDAEFERIVELANRTNQLNYTKVRLEKPEAVAAFRELCGSYGCSVGIVRAADRYGDYGIVGYFLQHRVPKKNELLHFVFSCRAMNMGVEQYVYELLGSPTINIVGPVSNPIQCFEKIDWIRDGRTVEDTSAQSEKALLLVGACDLLQLASMCGSRRSEFVNTIRKGWTVRFDDPGFIMSDRGKMKFDSVLHKLVVWTWEDAVRFDEALAASEVIITSMFGATAWSQFRTRKGTHIRIPPRNVKRILAKDAMWFVRNLNYVSLSKEERFKLVAKTMNYMAARRPDVHHFALGVNTRGFPGSAAGESAPTENPLADDASFLDDDENEETAQSFDTQIANRRAYNTFLKSYCELHPNFIFVDTDALVDVSDIAQNEAGAARFYPDHFTRKGNIALASFIKSAIATPIQKAPLPRPKDAAMAERPKDAAMPVRRPKTAKGVSPRQEPRKRPRPRTLAARLGLPFRRLARLKLWGPRVEKS